MFDIGSQNFTLGFESFNFFSYVKMHSSKSLSPWYFFRNQWFSKFVQDWRSTNLCYLTFGNQLFSKLNFCSLIDFVYKEVFLEPSFQIYHQPLHTVPRTSGLWSANSTKPMTNAFRVDTEWKRNRSRMDGGGNFKQWFTSTRPGCVVDCTRNAHKYLDWWIETTVGTITNFL